MNKVPTDPRGQGVERLVTRRPGNGNANEQDTSMIVAPVTAAPARKLSTTLSTILSVTLLVSLAGCALQTDVPTLPQTDIPPGFVMLPEAVDIAWPQSD